MDQKQNSSPCTNLLLPTITLHTPPNYNQYPVKPSLCVSASVPATLKLNWATTTTAPNLRPLFRTYRFSTVPQHSPDHGSPSVAGLPRLRKRSILHEPLVFLSCPGKHGERLPSLPDVVHHISTIAQVLSAILLQQVCLARSIMSDFFENPRNWSTTCCALDGEIKTRGGIECEQVYWLVEFPLKFLVRVWILAFCGLFFLISTLSLSLRAAFSILRTIHSLYRTWRAWHRPPTNAMPPAPWEPWPLCGCYIIRSRCPVPTCGRTTFETPQPCEACLRGTRGPGDNPPGVGYPNRNVPAVAAHWPYGNGQFCRRCKLARARIGRVAFVRQVVRWGFGQNVSWFVVAGVLYCWIVEDD